MPMVPFYTRFPELAELETRSLFLKNHEGLPDGEYTFLELYCDEADCNCERVIINVVTPKRPAEPLATIGFGWKTRGAFAKWLGRLGAADNGPYLDPINPQSKYAPALLDLFESTALTPDYVERLKRHYKLFKGIDAHPDPLGFEEEDETPLPSVDSLPPIDPEHPDVRAILAHLETETGVFPHAAVRAAIAMRDRIAPYLLGILEQDPEDVLERDHYVGHVLAMYLLAQFRDERAYPILLDTLTEDPDVLDGYFAEDLFEGVPKILASVSGGDLKPLERLVENADAFEDARAAAIDAMLHIVAARLQPRDVVMAYFRTLFDGGLDRDDDDVWTALVGAAVDLYPEEVAEQIAEAYEDDLVDEVVVSPEDVLKRLEKGSKAGVVEYLAKRGCGLVDDVAAEIGEWTLFRSAPKPEPRLVLDLRGGVFGDTPRHHGDKKAKRKRKAAKAAKKKNRR